MTTLSWEYGAAAAEPGAQRVAPGDEVVDDECGTGVADKLRRHVHLCRVPARRVQRGGEAAVKACASGGQQGGAAAPSEERAAVWRGLN